MQRYLVQHSRVYDNLLTKKDKFEKSLKKEIFYKAEALCTLPPSGTRDQKDRSYLGFSYVQTIQHAKVNHCPLVWGTVCYSPADI